MPYCSNCGKEIEYSEKRYVDCPECGKSNELCHSKSQQALQLKDIIDLTRAKATTKSKWDQLKAMQFKAKPAPPVKPAHDALPQKVYPVVKPTVRYEEKYGVMPIFIAIGASVVEMIIQPFIMEISLILDFIVSAIITGIVAFNVYKVIKYYKEYKAAKSKNIEYIKNSDEYKAQCAAVDAEYESTVKQLDTRYEAAMKAYEEAVNKYENVTLVKYEEEFNTWQQNQNLAIQQEKRLFMDAGIKLKHLYEDTNMIPEQYRDIDILEYLYSTITSADYTIKEAIDIYDRNEQRKLDTARLQEQQLSNAYANQQNELLAESNYIADKARRDANISSVIGAVQRHNTNKQLKNIHNKM